MKGRRKDAQRESAGSEHLSHGRGCSKTPENIFGTGRSALRGSQNESRIISLEDVLQQRLSNVLTRRGIVSISYGVPQLVHLALADFGNQLKSRTQFQGLPSMRVPAHGKTRPALLLLDRPSR